MKPTALTAIFLFIFTFCFSQSTGNITPKVLAPRAGVENVYVYEPPKGLLIPDNAQASIVYISKKGYFNKKVPIKKIGNEYEFAYKAPDSTEVLIMGIVDEDQNVVDINNDLGFVSYLHDKNSRRYPNAGITSASLLAGYASYILKIKVPATTLIKQYEKEYKLHPSLTNEVDYVYYLNLLYSVKKDTVKPLLIAYAKKMLAAKNDEVKWTRGANVYGMLQMEEELKKSQATILAAYPNGQLAIDKFWNEYYSDKQPTEATRLAAMKKYINRFKDSSTNITDRFYSQIINSFLQNKDWEGINRYEHLVSNKLQLASMYNEVAWALSGQGLEREGSDLDYAKTVSKKSVDIVEERMNNQKNDDETELLINSHIGYTDTYALVLYKLKQYDSAFYYQHAILERGPMGVEGMERYAAYAEKAKGALFAKQFIEPQLLKGANSPVMQKQLLSIYRQLNLPEEQYNIIAEKANLVANEKTAALVKAKYGTVAAKDFTLNDLQGNAVTLSSLKNKVVVLDFWATWCGPCRASFPEMQEAVTKYKDDNEVVFLFIDTYERKEPKAMQEATAKFIDENKYSFQVLLDTKDEVAANYKVEGIPSKFIINKKGDIIFMGNSLNDIAAVIENAKK